MPHVKFKCLGKTAKGIVEQREESDFLVRAAFLR